MTSKKPTKEQLIKDFEYLTYTQVAQKYLVCRSMVQKWVRSYGLKPREISKIATAEKIRQGNLLAWNKEKCQEHAIKMKEICNTDEYKSNHSKIMTVICADPKYRKLQSEILTKIKNCPEEKLKQSIRAKELWQDPEYIKHSLAAAKIKCNDPEYKKKLSVRSKEMWQNPEFCRRMAIIRSNIPRSLTQPHLKVCEILKSLNIEYKVEYPLGPWVYDIFIPSHSILIEVQGEYWHNLPRALRNDKAKSTYIQKYFPQYKLNYILEHECIEIGRVEAKLKYWLGLDRIEQIEYDLDNVKIDQVDKKIADIFLYNWHYQHVVTYGMNIGGYLGDQLICLAKFTPSTRNEIATKLGYKTNEVLELSRLCVHPKYQKHNLLSWFLARCEKQIRLIRPDIKCLVSFADSTFNHTGAVYKASNWTLVDTIPPDYFYVSQDGFVMHKKTLWNRSSKNNMSESEYAEKYGYSKVWGKEKYKFIKVFLK